MVILFSWIVAASAAGALLGLIPYFLCKGQGKPNMAQMAIVCCMVGGSLGLALFVAIGFAIAAFVSSYDTRPIFHPRRPVPPATGPAYYEYNDQPVRLGLACLSGPLKGRVYRVGRDGLMVGRDYDCGIRFGTGTPGISRHHCSIRWYQGGAALVDLGSNYGTFLADGTQLPPNYPLPVHVGSRFYLGSTQYLFEIVQTR